MLNLLVDSIGTAKILLLVNYRPEYRHEWGNKSYYSQLRLDPLAQESAEQMVSTLTGNDPRIIPLRRMIIERTDGNPFFIEEIVQELFEDGVLARNGTIRLLKPLSMLKLPATVQAVLASRIDRLPPTGKELLQTLSVIGREFSQSLVARVVPPQADDLNEMLADLQVAEFIYEQPAAA